ncbi:hypothetical protein CAEBREN_15209 [Caenorhabditis brenneri]|uniref:Uncharacterized protein n=1 Tax=Caenorhabditis brenneri TaxID=135651 RepID=G0N3X8_CAEBE|nr:hypothetical protein CAEBREN_15209 [Caenorhabditis brenneri]
MTSKRNEKIVKLARLKTGYFRFEFCDDVSVHLPHLKLNVFFEKHHGRMETSFSMMTKGDMKSWMPKSPLNKRKKTLLSIGYDIKRRYLMLLAWDVNKKFTPSVSEKENKKFENVGKILTLLHKKKKLEDLREVSSGEAKMELNEKINESIAELSEFNVTFIDGKVTHRLF